MPTSSSTVMLSSSALLSHSPIACSISCSNRSSVSSSRPFFFSLSRFTASSAMATAAANSFDNVSKVTLCRLSSSDMEAFALLMALPRLSLATAIEGSWLACFSFASFFFCSAFSLRAKACCWNSAALFSATSFSCSKSRLTETAGT